MAVNLLEQFLEKLEPSIIDESKASLGIAEEKSRAAIRHILASVLGSVAQKGSTEPGASEILRFLKENALDGQEFVQSPRFNGDQQAGEKEGTAHRVLEFLFGEHSNQVRDLISHQAGIEPGKTAKLLQSTGVSALGLLAQYLQEKSIDELGLKNLLHDQEETLAQHLPSGLKSLPVFADLTGVKEKPGENPVTVHKDQSSSRGIADQSIPPVPDTNETSPFGKILPWIMLALASLALLWFLNEKQATEPFVSDANGSQQVSESEATRENEYSGDTISVAVPGEIDVHELKLPDGTVIRTWENSFLSVLYGQLTEDQTEGFSPVILEDVRFQPVSAKLTDRAEDQLMALSALLEAFPEQEISIVTANASLGAGEGSQVAELAAVVRSRLIDNGIEPGRIRILEDGKGDFTSDGSDGTQPVTVVAIQLEK